MITSKGLTCAAGPSFQWNVLNYGRIANNVKLQDARFRELVALYQNTVLQADLEVENGIVSFLQAQQRASDLRESVDQSWLALQIIVAQYQAGLAGVDFNRYATIQQNLLSQQDSWAQSRGQIATGLIQVYRSLGGGWQIKLGQVPDKQGCLSPVPAANGAAVAPPGVNGPVINAPGGVPAEPVPASERLPAP